MNILLLGAKVGGARRGGGNKDRVGQERRARGSLSGKNRGTRCRYSR
jgi:hypothetical protein